MTSGLRPQKMDTAKVAELDMKKRLADFNIRISADHNRRNPDVSPRNCQTGSISSSSSFLLLYF